MSRSDPAVRAAVMTLPVSTAQRACGNSSATRARASVTGFFVMPSRVGPGAVEIKRFTWCSGGVLYQLLATATMTFHFMFLAYLVTGGFIAWRWPRTIWLHLAVVLWGFSTVAFGF